MQTNLSAPTGEPKEVLLSQHLPANGYMLLSADLQRREHAL
eukprot:SAG31_NODE_40296_length_281_cov_1.401099_2_plen_40_part_01